MKKLIVMILALSMAVSMAGCCNHKWEAATCESPKICNNCSATEGEPLGHTPGKEAVTAVDTEALSVTYETLCSVCGAATQTRESSTGIPPVDGVMRISPDEWFACLTTNIVQYGASQTLVPHSVESEDNALVQGVVSMSGMKAVISFWGADGNTLSTEQREQRDIVSTLCVEAQFTNDTATDFYTMLMLFALTNNSELDLESANTICSQIMGFETVTDNGYTYALEIVSKEDHTVALTITAE